MEAVFGGCLHVCSPWLLKLDLMASGERYPDFQQLVIWNHLLNVQLARRLQEIDIFYFVEIDNSQQQQKTRFIIFAFS